MPLTSDHTLAGMSGPVLTSDHTSRLVSLGRPDRPHLFARVYMQNHFDYHFSKTLNRYGQCGQWGQLNSIKGSARPHLALMVRTVRPAVMFHANPSEVGSSVVERRQARQLAPSARVLPGPVNCGYWSAQFSHMFSVPSLVPNGTGGRA